ncbi:MAG: hypothetical protein KatS3mg068_1665 [Candidatus Sericytochromatia bacterium]|nr:MAG: hypothetical protein KatS3mg068_1665 [Candidatus Sericytochromatia bacterium]
MKILIFSIYNQPEQLISSFKVYESNKNEDVYFLNCSNSLKFCDINSDNYFQKCFECIADKFFLFRLFNIEEKKLIDIDSYEKINVDIPLFDSIDDLKSFTYNNINYGLYAYKSVVNITKKEKFNIKFVRYLIKNIINEAINFYNKISNIIDNIKPDKFYIYKNNSIIYLPIIELALIKNIETITFYVDNNVLYFYNAKTNEQLNYNIFLEKIDNEYLINGQKISKIIYARTKNEILKAIVKYNHDLFSNNVETFKFFRDLEKQNFWTEEESNIIKNKVLEIYNKLDKKSKEAKENVKISACMIVKNEEKNLERCLNSIKNIVDEIIILDTGSTDNTINIAKKYTSKIFEYKWKDDFSDARNKSISYAKNDWILIIDADEELTENTQKNLLITIYDEPLFKEELVFWFKCFNKYPNEQESTFYFKHFLFNKKHGFVFEGKVHEYLVNPNQKEKDKVFKKTSTSIHSKSLL